jgi:hypothetical protein
MEERAFAWQLMWLRAASTCPISGWSFTRNFRTTPRRCSIGAAEPAEQAAKV